MMETNPELLWRKVALVRSPGLRMRFDIPPFNDVNVRRAVMLATNNQEIADELYGGSPIFNSPVADTPLWSNFHVPLEEMPQSVQELYGYDPEKAIQLLADAGYPEGFKTTLELSRPQEIPLYSMLKEYWAKVGIDMEIEMMEPAVSSAIVRVQQGGGPPEWEGLSRTSNAGAFPTALYGTRPQPDGHFSQFSEADYAASAQYLQKMNEGRFFIKDPVQAIPQMREAVKEYATYFNENVLELTMPGVPSFSFWWPYVKGYHGETTDGYFPGYRYLQFIWMDTDQKFEMTGKR
jgi:peptide/nickel transport system substrate-binding protein